MKRNILLWSLYDFANSIVMIVFLFYFSQWLVVDGGRPDWWYNATLIVASLLFVVTAPIAGQRLDRSGGKLAGVRATSAILFLFFSLTAIVTLFFPSQHLLATVLYTIAMYVYLMSFVYYTPMINDLTDGKNRGWISGLGMGANYAGQVFGLLATLPFATGAVTLFGASGRAQAFVPALVLFAVAALPMLWLYRDSSARKDAVRLRLADECAEVGRTVKTILSNRNLSLLLVAYFLFGDALLTFSNNFPIYLEKVFAAPDATKTYLTAGILLVSIAGSLVFGKISDRIGTKKALLVILAFWVAFFPVLAFAPSLGVASAACLVAGFFFGPAWVVSRSMASEFIPREAEGSSFSFYTLMERFATFVGPISWSVVLAATAGSGNAGYSYALMAMGALVLLGLLVVRKIATRA